MKRVSQPHLPGSTVYWTTYTYDARGQTVSVVAPDAASTMRIPKSGTVSCRYNAQRLVATKTDANGNVLTYSYDGYNRLSQVSLGLSVLRADSEVRK